MKPFVPLQVTAEECGGSFDKMLRRFTRRTREDGIIEEYRASLVAEKPCVARRRKRREALRREKSQRREKSRRTSF